jgi:hypothetical protein
MHVGLGCSTGIAFKQLQKRHKLKHLKTIT